MADREQVPDIRLVQNNAFPKYSVTVDWSLLPDGTLDDRQALATAVIVALGTDALASEDDILPDPDSTDRAGWWGDMDADVIWNGWPIGSKLWLLRRSKITPAAAHEGSMLARVEN
jgi:phage gp46-like protein